MVPWLALGLGQVDLRPGAGLDEGLGRVAAELAAAKDVWPEEVDEGCSFVE